DGVDVRRGQVPGYRDVALAGPAQHVEEHVPGAGSAALVDQAVEGLEPLLGLGGVDVLDLAEQTVDERSRSVLSPHTSSFPQASGAPTRVAGARCHPD